MHPGTKAALRRAQYLPLALALGVTVTSCRDEMLRPGASAARGPAVASRVVAGVPWQAGGAVPTPLPTNEAPQPGRATAPAPAELVPAHPRPTAAPTSPAPVRDILWQNNSTGVRALWQVTSSVVSGTLGLGYVPVEWQIVGAGDFNADGRGDIVFQDTVTGGTAVWLMDGAGGYQSTLIPGGVPPEWRSLGAGDYNGDSADDILWQNLTTGALALWLMDGSGGILAAASLGSVPPTWRATAARDLNGDGNDDILWRNTTTGEVVIWYMDGHGSVSSGQSLGTVPTAWSIAGAADFDGDGNTDILWHNPTTGAIATWYMNGAGAISSTGMTGYGAPVGWQAAAALVPTRAAANGWTLAWSDEFNGPLNTGVDPTRWLYDTGTGYPGGPGSWGTGEVETMTSLPANVSLDGLGHLRIIPLVDGNGHWTSGRIESRRTDFQPPSGGVLAVEAAIQQPNVSSTAALGYWPAFWLLGAPYRGVYTNWPSVGELDVMETINGRASVFTTLHCGLTWPGPCNEPTGLSSGEKPCPGCKTAFHTFRLEWDRSTTPQTLRWYLDGVQTFTVTANQVDAASWAAATNHGYFIILDLAMGGGFPGAFGGGPTAATASGVPMLIDYVRVFTR